jgi:hypothetical protein
MLVRYVFTALVAAGLAFAQEDPMGSMGRGGGGGMGRGGGGGADMGGAMGGTGGGGAMPRRQSKLEMFVDKLKLKNDQKDDVQRIFSSAMEKATPVRDQLNKGRQVIAQAILSKASDDDVKKLMDQYAVDYAQMTGIEAEAFGKVYAILKPNQQQKAAQAFELMAGLFYPAGGFGGGGRGRGNREGGR